jgi:hypothetical protein
VHVHVYGQGQESRSSACSERELTPMNGVALDPQKLDMYRHALSPLLSLPLNLPLPVPYSP